MADLELTSNVLVNNFIASDLSIIHHIELSALSETYNIILNSILNIGSTTQLTSNSSFESYIESYLTISSDEILSSSSIINSFSICKLTIEIKCFNCKFNSGKSLVKNGPKCFRLARSKNEHTVNDCSMYKKMKDN